ncbi:MAG TPA: TMEM175 family protein [Bryobacteraceae bacterium]|nr:TMEM175 family protein [Bryobacteraceae bacterium]
MGNQPTPKRPPSTARLEAFSDGVIAVIITIMVLELKVPHADGWAGLYAILPILPIYLLSFTFTGIYWINHHHLIERIDSADSLILYANLGFLFCLSLLPFATSYVLEKKVDSFAVCLYAVSMVACGFSFLLLRLAIHRNLRRSGQLESEDVSAQGKHLASLALYLVAIPLAFFHSRIALLIIALVTVVWIVPNLSVRR